MTTSIAIPACNQDIFKGERICSIAVSAERAEKWVHALRAHAAVDDIDWHFLGGRAVVLHLGDKEERGRVLTSVERLTFAVKREIRMIAEVSPA